MQSARGEAFDNYRRVEQFNLPANTVAFDALPDGRIIGISGLTILVESAVRSRQFTSLAALADADIPGFGAAFLRVSLDGSLLAVGNNGGTFGDNYEVGIFSTTDLSGRWLSAPHFDAAWIDDTHLAITYGNFSDPSVVTILDVDSADSENPSNPVVIGGIGGASGGVAFDSAVNLYTGNGFALAGPSGTGTVKAFAAVEWMSAYQTSSPLNFETQGIFVVDALSASPLEFDSEGNLIIAGGDFSDNNHKDYVGLAHRAAIDRALSGGSAVDISNPTEFQRLDPDTGSDSNFYAFAYNMQLSEVYMRNFGSDLVYVYRDITGIPAVSSWGLLCLGLLSTTAGTLLISRRTAAGLTVHGAVR